MVPRCFACFGLTDGKKLCHKDEEIVVSAPVPVPEPLPDPAPVLEPKASIEVLMVASHIASDVDFDTQKESILQLASDPEENNSTTPEESRRMRPRTKTFRFADLAKATKNFRLDHHLGSGGFGHVYKGELADGQVVAIKQLDRSGTQGNREFIVEVIMLSLLHHPNLVTLIGYCAEHNQRLLVYEFMALGSLEDHLHAKIPNIQPLDWATRMKIATGVAKGLDFLHNKANPPVIYRDLKSANILLDGDYNPKLSDFGLARLGPVGDKTHVSTRVMGTLGYCAPEYAMTGKLTVKSDVYSFGVMFLELITGRKAIDVRRPNKERNLVEWAKPLFNNQRNFSRMVDPSLRGQYPRRELYQAFAIISFCLREQYMTRPSIREVLDALTYLATRNCNINTNVNGNNYGCSGAGSSRHKYEVEASHANNVINRRPKSTRLPNLDRYLNRERAVAVTKLTGIENLKGKRSIDEDGENYID